jgi:hypothetical protein
MGWLKGYSTTPHGFTQGQALALIVYVSGIAAIIGLSNFVCPDTVFFAIGAIVIHTFNAQVWMRSWSHIAKKLFKRLPFYRNPPASISRETVIVGIQASSFHVTPNIIFRRLPHAMCPILVSRCFNTKTPTALRVVSSQGRAKDNSHNPTVTQAFPSDKSGRTSWALFLDEQTTKTLSFKRNEIAARLGFFPAPTTNGISRPQSVGNDKNSTTTIAKTVPLCIPVRPIWAAFLYHKVSESLTKKRLEIMVRHEASLQAKVRWLGLPGVRPQELRLAKQPNHMSISEKTNERKDVC